MKQRITIKNYEKHKCDKCGEPLLLMYGCGWDYDRVICSKSGCDFEVEYETSTTPPSCYFCIYSEQPICIKKLHCFKHDKLVNEADICKDFKSESEE